jgi:hypothetical protein
MKPNENSARYESLLSIALTSAFAASKKLEREMVYDRGACGFAWVKIDGTEPLARYCRAELKRLAKDPESGSAYQKGLRYGDKGEPGWMWWDPGRSNWQNIDVKEAGAKAFRDVLGAYGIRADAGSRLD